MFLTISKVGAGRVGSTKAIALRLRQKLLPDAWCLSNVWWHACWASCHSKGLFHRFGRYASAPIHHPFLRTLHTHVLGPALSCPCLFRSGGCRYVCSITCGNGLVLCQILVREFDGHRAFTNCRGNSVHGTRSHIARSEYTRYAGF